MYTTRRPSDTGTRRRIMTAVRETLEEGVFHETTVEEIAARAGVSRATLYQHFGSRLGLVDAICDSFDENPALVAIRQIDDLDAFLERVVEFWATEEKLLIQLYGAAAVDPAARALVDRQRRDRHGELRRVLRSAGAEGPRALPTLSLLTSFETFEELRRHTGLSKREVVRVLQDAAARLLATG